jgi:hypothetical protein
LRTVPPRVAGYDRRRESRGGMVDVFPAPGSICDVENSLGHGILHSDDHRSHSQVIGLSRMSQPEGESEHFLERRKKNTLDTSGMTILPSVSFVKPVPFRSLNLVCLFDEARSAVCAAGTPLRSPKHFDSQRRQVRQNGSQARDSGKRLFPRPVPEEPPAAAAAFTKRTRCEHCHPPDT